ncbi:uncharacterized mitochondrial protein AtMg00860-like [Medicago truncatula]|uniref:uncharacterized mitochondrial protein AtMg00860-like n=1 Tax=Medicago truncatula TaxID=3880 RepID=UPI001966CE9E|nr:uncharacterized mitochondrial protein AtMg00860-like [Medicago truncatula]
MEISLAAEAQLVVVCVKVPVDFELDDVFFTEGEVSFLRLVISKGGIAVDPSKVDAVLQWKSPKSVFEIRSFLGLTAHVWDAKCEKSFQELKKRLASVPVLILPNLKESFVVYCDASKIGLGGVLMQNRQDVAYVSSDASIKYLF